MTKVVLFIYSILGVVGLIQHPAPVDTHELSGVVLDDAQQPLFGAGILLLGTSIGAVTDIDGKFSIHAPTPCADLVVSYVGYKEHTARQVCAGKPARIRMTSAGQQLDVVTVTSMKPRAKIESYGVSAMPAGSALSNRSYHMPVDEGEQNWNTEDYGLIEENRFLRPQNQPLSTFSIDVDAASYANLRRFLHTGDMPPKDAVRIEEMVNYFDYDYPGPADEHPFRVVTELSTCPWAQDHHLLHVGLQGKRIPTDDLPASNLVFLIDVSGSMNTPSKLPLLKQSFKLLTRQLRAQDKVSIVVYAGAAGLVLPPTDGNNHQAILEALNQLHAGGSTAGAQGIQLAYKTARKQFVKGGNNRVILATDGDFNIGQSSDAELVRLIEKERESGVYLTVMGFGTGNYKDNKMQMLANKGNGNHAYIDNISEARKVLVHEFGGTLFTIAKDVKLQLEFNPATVAGYRLIGYENRLLNSEDFNDDKKDAGELGSGHTVTALYEIIPAGVESDFLADVDDLKYQQPKSVRKNQGELLTLKLRYKLPDQSTSIKMETTVANQPLKASKTSDNFRWSAAVAAFGMLLRDSPYKGTANYLHTLQLAQKARGQDPNGYRAECIDMMQTVQDLYPQHLEVKQDD